MQFKKHPAILKFSAASLTGTAHGSESAKQDLIATMIPPVCGYKHQGLL
jgi:hypothetical protein